MAHSVLPAIMETWVSRRILDFRIQKVTPAPLSDRYNLGKRTTEL